MQQRAEMTKNLQGISLMPRSVLMKTNHHKLRLTLCLRSFGMTSKISQLFNNRKFTVQKLRNGIKGLTSEKEINLDERTHSITFR